MNIPFKYRLLCLVWVMVWGAAPAAAQDRAAAAANHALDCGAPQETVARVLAATLDNRLTREEGEKRSRAIAIIEAVNRELDTGNINYIFDMNNSPLAYYDLKKKCTVSLTPGFDFSPFNHQL